MTKAQARRYVKVVEVYTSEVFNKPGPTVRCCASGCGDKIKPLESSDTCLEITWLDGDVTYLEWGCMEWFVNGHPDYGHGFGKILEIIGENQITLLPCPYEDREILFCLGLAAEMKAPT